MKKANRYSKKELTGLVKARITTGLSEIINLNEGAENVQKAIKKASKLISSELQKDLKIQWKAESITTSEPAPIDNNIAGKAVKKTGDAKRVVKVKASKKTIKKAKAAKKAVNKVKAAKKAVKKVKAAKNLINVNGIEQATDSGQAPVPQT